MSDAKQTPPENKNYVRPMVMRDELAAWLHDYESVDYSSTEAAAEQLERLVRRVVENETAVRSAAEVDA